MSTCWLKIKIDAVKKKAKTDDPGCSCLLIKMQFFPSWSSSKENLSRRFHVNTGLLGRSGDFLPRGNFCRTSKYPLLVSYLSRRVGFQLFLLYRGSTFSISHCVRVSYMSILINDWYNILIMINLPFNCFFTTGVNFLIQSLHK